MYRKAADNLEDYFNTLPKNPLLQAKLAIASLAKFHTTFFSQPLPQHEPMADLERRFFTRFEENPSAQRLKILFWNLLNKIQGIPQSPLHRDAYPSNFLVGGTILDFEKISGGLHWFDFETFVGHPSLQPYTRELAIDYMNQTPSRGFSQEGREVAALVSSTCQIGSFSQKEPRLSEYFFRRTLDLAEQTGQRQLGDHLEAYLEPRFSQ